MLSIGKALFGSNGLAVFRRFTSCSPLPLYRTRPLAIVTGGAQGVGYILSERLIQQGYVVCLADVNEDLGEESAQRLQQVFGPETARFRKCDVTSEEEFKETFSTLQELGQIKLLVNNAAVVDEYDARRSIDINLKGVITGCQLALKFMGTSSGGNGGTVVNLGSIGSFLPYANTPIYIAAKHGVIGLTRSYGHEAHLKRDGVMFSAMCLMYVNTPLIYSAKTLSVFEHTAEVQFLEPQMVADGITKLLKDQLNGSTLLVLKDRMEYVEIPDDLKNIER